MAGRAVAAHPTVSGECAELETTGMELLGEVVEIVGM